MTDEEILEAAVEELSELDYPKLWMTERGLAKRLRRRAAMVGLDHVRLRGVLMDHAAGRPRQLRNSSSPSLRTLEVLWGAICEGGVQEADVPLPTLKGGLARVDPSGRRGQSEFGEEEEAADFFLSYRMADETHARYVVRTVERSGYSVWDAGSFIVDEEHINDRVLEAMNHVHKQLIYLSDSALGSLWVGKEVIHGDRLELDQTIVLKGDDDSLMESVYRMLDGEAPEFPPYREVSSQAVEMFRNILRTELAREEKIVYLHPVPIGNRWREYERLVPIFDFAQSPVEM
jgi:hypothetical protein